MNTESHFVVVYDHVTKKFSIDEGTTWARFPDGMVFQEGLGWIIPEEGSQLEEDSYNGQGHLVKLLTEYNENSNNQ